MKLPLYDRLFRQGKKWVYLLLFFLGTITILLCSMVQHIPEPPRGEYYVSKFFSTNYTIAVKITFMVIGLLAGFVYRLNPWWAGISLHLIFPVTAIVESVVYRGSHNLLPFEFAMHGWLALPSIAAVFAGRLVARLVEKRSA